MLASVKSMGTFTLPELLFWVFSKPAQALKQFQSLTVVP